MEKQCNGTDLITHLREAFNIYNSATEKLFPRPSITWHVSYFERNWCLKNLQTSLQGYIEYAERNTPSQTDRYKKLLQAVNYLILANHTVDAFDKAALTQQHIDAANEITIDIHTDPQYQKS